MPVTTSNLKGIRGMMTQVTGWQAEAATADGSR
jgi:hypothetical protein